MTATTSCSTCGHHPSERRPALLWSMSVHDGRRAFTCSPCVRTALDTIESGIRPA